MNAPLPLPDAARLIRACEATWPPAATSNVGAWTIRAGNGGGKRVSAATENWPTTEADLPAAEAAQRALGQDPLFMIRAGEEHLDDMLAAHGYAKVDPVNIYAIETAELAAHAAPLTSGIPVWPPLAIQRDIWAGGGIGPARLRVMERAPFPKTALIGRTEDKPAGTAFVGIHDGIAMLHALEVAPHMRRKGTGRNLLIRAAQWARGEGAEFFALIVTRGNHAANPLYAALGMGLVGHYHYRIKPKAAESDPT
ncbi:MAG TPA: GNAT family N-acetyltransferase [Aliiroseovarius sp.]|nr:GNAT family N-acetyltransferase [Aliiroseovarius sp.]